jgi:hypothetical protein
MADVSNTFTLNHEAAGTPGHMDFVDIFPDIYDTTNNALRIRTVRDDSACADTLDAGQIIEVVYDQSNHCLNVFVVGAASTSNTDLDWKQVIKYCLDTDKGKLRMVT